MSTIKHIFKYGFIMALGFASAATVAALADSFEHIKLLSYVPFEVVALVVFLTGIFLSYRLTSERVPTKNARV